MIHSQKLAAGMGGAALLSINPSYDDGDSSSSEGSSNLSSRSPQTAVETRRGRPIQPLQRKRSMSFDDVSPSPATTQIPSTTAASRPPIQRKPMRNTTMRLLPSGVSNSISAAVAITSDHGERARSRSLGNVSLASPTADGMSSSLFIFPRGTISTSPAPLEERIAFKKFHL